MKEEIYSIIHKCLPGGGGLGGVIQANSKKALLEGLELEILRDPETRFLQRQAAEEYLERLIKKYGLESERVKLLKQRIRDSFKREDENE